ncbi:MAG: hypothetical protein ACHQ0J_01825 [Candidatus Dormibacterales bacterium]
MSLEPPRLQERADELLLVQLCTRFNGMSEDEARHIYDQVLARARAGEEQCALVVLEAWADAYHQIYEADELARTYGFEVSAEP